MLKGAQPSRFCAQSGLFEHFFFVPLQYDTKDLH